MIGIFFGGYSIEQPAFKSWDVGGMTGALVSVFVCNHRLRRVFRLSRIGLFRHDFKTDRQRNGHPFDRLWRDARRRICRIYRARNDYDRRIRSGKRRFTRKNIRQRNRKFSDDLDRKRKSAIRDNIRRDGFFDLCFRHFGRFAPTWSIHRSGTFRYSRERSARLSEQLQRLRFHSFAF